MLVWEKTHYAYSTTPQKVNQVCGKHRLTTYITNFGMLARSEVTNRENKPSVMLERDI